jgi:hypothetical protein
LSFEKYPNILAWYENMKSIKGWEENEEGAVLLGSIVQKFLTEPM